MGVMFWSLTRARHAQVNAMSPALRRGFPCEGCAAPKEGVKAHRKPAKRSYDEASPVKDVQPLRRSKSTPESSAEELLPSIVARDWDAAQHYQEEKLSLSIVARDWDAV